jgi:crossover junction endodeoxyribonuclease RuvC
MTKQSASKLKVLGIDPGTATTGWAVLEEERGEIKTLAYGHISTDKSLSDEKRLVEISEDLEKIICKFSPQEAAVEKLFFFKNKKTIIEVAQARGAILLTISAKNVKVSGYTPLQIKQALTGYGRADKNQIQEMTKNILRLKSLPKPDDTADAIAIALCHIHSRKILNTKSQITNHK